MEDRTRRRPGDAARRRDRRRAGTEYHSAQRTRAPRRPWTVSGSSSTSKSRSQQQLYPTRKPQRRSVESVRAEASEFVPSLGINPVFLHKANNSKYTGLHHCCTRCTPGSQRRFSGHTEGMCGLINILQVDRRRFRRLPYRLAPFLSFVSQQPMPYHMIDYRRVTLSSARVQEAIKECACESVSQEVASDPVALRCAERKHQRRAAGIIGAMSSAVYRPLVRLVGWLFFWTFGKLFGRLDIQQSHMGMLLHAQKEGIPMVFLPNHKSHMDYLILTFVLFSLGVKTPRVAAGDNLRLPFVSWLVTHLGGFFIKRKLDSSVHKDVLYRKCLQEYMERCLYAGENLEFFLEGSRSRSGKPCSPKAGLLSVVVDAVKQGVVEDVLLVPVNISYDKILERSFVKDELMGGVKKPETVMQAVRGAWSILTRKVGAVRVDISQPFSLQEYLSKAVVSEGSLLELSHSSLRGSGASLAQLSHRRLITALSYHIMYDITQCTSLTPTGMVAFLLLNKYREQGATVDELVASYLQLEKLAETRGRVISSFLGAGEAVHCALHHICHLITVDSAPCEQNLSGLVASSNQKVRPRLELPDIFDLYHLSNQVSPLVAMQAIVARSILSVAKEVKRNKKNIKREKVIQSASFLARMMAREFIVTPPCEELTLALQEEVDNFVNSEILKIVGPSYHGNRNRDLDLDEEDWYEHVPDVEYELDSQADGWGQLALISSVLEPLLEGYWLVATQLLLSLPHGSGPLLTEAELVSQYQQVTTAKAHKGLLARVESCSTDTLRNAVKVLQDLDVLVPGQSGDRTQDRALRVANTNRLVGVIKNLTLLRS